MERKQVDLLFKVLRLLQDEDLLRHFVIAGSWCFYFYRFYFSSKPIVASLRTRDIDFLVPKPKAINKKIDLVQLLKPLGFIVDYRGEEGFIRLVHPEFFIEFLVPDKGRGLKGAFALPALGLNAQALRFLDILYLQTVSVKEKGLEITLPHPACFLLHKIIIFKRRPTLAERSKEIEQIGRMIEILKKENQLASLKSVFLKLHPKWQKRVRNNLNELAQGEIVDILQ